MKDKKVKPEGIKTEKNNEESIENSERIGDMIIGRIYDKVFVPMSEVSGNTDGTMDDRLLLLLKGADIEHMNKAQLADLVCKGVVTGEKEGFISGVRFTARLIYGMFA